MSKLDRVYAELQGRILKGVWKCGDRIPTEVELAADLGFSQGTVSKAMTRLAHDGLVERRKRGGTRVIRSTPAHEARRPQLDAMAFIYPSEQHEGIRRIVQGFQKAAHAVKRRVVLLTTGTDFHKETEIVGRLDEFDVKGAVIYPVLPEPSDQLYFGQMLRDCRFPVVLTDITLPGLGCPAVVIDGFHAAHTMTRHLLAQGLKRIGFLSNGAWVPSTRDRYQGYRRALEESGVVEQPGWVLQETGMHPDFEDPLAEARSLTKRFLEGTDGLEGVVCSDDFLALGCLVTARELGIRVPDQLKVVGATATAISPQGEPPLTTYLVPFEELGRQAFQMLNRLLEGEKLLKMEIQIRGDLVIRQSG